MKRSPLLAVFVVVLIDLMGFGIVLPLLPFYASEFHASSTSIGLLYSIYSLAQLVFSPIWGSLSDRIGRRPIMILSTFGASLAYLLFAFSHSFALLFISRLVAGIMGGNISTAYAYVTDVTRPEDRAKGMGLIGAAFGIGFVLGPAIASVLVHPSVAHHSANPFFLPGLFASGMSLLSLLLVVFQLPETVVIKKERKSSEPFLKSGIFSSSFWKTIFSSHNQAHPYLFSLLILCVFLLSFGQSTLYSAFPLFCESQLKLSAHDVGLQFGFMGLIAILVQGGLIRVLTKRFKEKQIFLVGSVGLVVGMLLLPWAKSTTALTIFLSILALGGSLCMPTINSLVSKQASSEHIGMTLGASQSISGLGRVVGPTWGGALFALGFKVPFLLTALILCVMCGVGIFIQKINQ
jgi:multidrug resistance protein